MQLELDLAQTAEPEFDPDADRLREECGVFGIFGHPDAAAITALGLHALQHRGQEAAGIVSYDAKRFYSERRLGLVSDAFAHQLPAQRDAVGEVAVMADGEAAGVQLGEQWLHIAQDGGAGGGIAHMADGGRARQALDHLAAGEGVADEAEAPFAVEAAAVEGNDAGGLLAAVLEGVQAESRQRRGVLVTEHAEHAALLSQRVAFEIILELMLDRAVGEGMVSVLV